MNSLTVKCQKFLGFGKFNVPSNTDKASPEYYNSIVKEFGEDEVNKELGRLWKVMTHTMDSQVEELVEDINDIDDNGYAYGEDGYEITGYANSRKIATELIQKKGYRKCIKGQWRMVQGGSGVCSNCNRIDTIDSLAHFCRYCGAELEMPSPEDVDKYYSPEEVRKMTPDEVRTKYTAIKKSMEQWK